METVKLYTKGQIGMMEMIMVMVVIMILLVIGMVFYFKFSISSTEERAERITEEKAAVIISTIAQLPEIECSDMGSRTTACVDTVKLLALSEKDKKGHPDFVEHRVHYSNLFGLVTIKFEQLYPQTSGKECDDTIFKLPDYPEIPPEELSCGNWTIYDNPKQGADIEYTPFRTMPVALYYPTRNMYALGQMKVYFY